MSCDWCNEPYVAGTLNCRGSHDAAGVKHREAMIRTQVSVHGLGNGPG